VASELKNKVLLEDATERNGDLKAVIRRMDSEMEMLKSEKELLMR
jgi:hypothetical protein